MNPLKTIKRFAAGAGRWLRANAGALLETAGLGVLIWATWQIHPIAGWYALGAALTLLGVVAQRR